MGECAGAVEAQRQPRYRDRAGERRPSNQLKPQLAANQAAARCRLSTVTLPFAFECGRPVHG